MTVIELIKQLSTCDRPVEQKKLGEKNASVHRRKKRQTEKIRHVSTKNQVGRVKCSKRSSSMKIDFEEVHEK